MIRLFSIKASNLPSLLLIGDDDDEIQAASSTYGLPVFKKNGCKFCLLNNGVEKQLKNAGIVYPDGAEETALKAVYGI